jgi:peroxiredoxin
MTNSLMQWHLARDNQSKLHKFCEKHKTTSVTDLDGKDTFTIRYFFDNGGMVLVELLKGTKNRSFTVADHFQVITYEWGTK